MAERSEYLRPHGAERVITAGRLLLAGFLVLAVGFADAEPARHHTLLQNFSFAYLLYAAAVALLVWTRRTSPRGLPLSTHVVDFVLFSVFMHLTAATTSPFFVYLIFSIVCGVLRWHGRGALLTGAAALAAYVGIVVLGKIVPAIPDEIERTRFITRCAHLSVVTLLLAYLGTYQRRLQNEIAALAAWPRQLPTDEDAAIQEVLAHAGDILRTRRMVLVWEQAEEPSRRIAEIDGGVLELSTTPPGRFGELVAERLQHSNFLCDDASRSGGYVVQRLSGGFSAWEGQPLDQSFRERYRVTSVLALRVATERIQGRLFALDQRQWSTDDLVLGDIVGQFVASALEQQTLIAELKDHAVSEERLRLAQDLHDGVLQSLTAIALQAGRIRADLGNDPSQAEARIAHLEQTIATEQRGLRLMLDELHPGRQLAGARSDLAVRVGEVVQEVGRQWEIAVDLALSPGVPAGSRGFVHEVCRMAREAVVNAIRHGGARKVHVRLEPAERNGVRLRVSYAGRGFATFEGRYDLATLERMEVGPRSLKERVARLGGDLVVDSHPEGATVEIVVPTR